MSEKGTYYESEIEEGSILNVTQPDKILEQFSENESEDKISDDLNLMNGNFILSLFILL